MENGKYKVSIIMPIYNAATRGRRYFQQAVKSIINQSYSNIELILINDGSSDGVKTTELLKMTSKWDNRVIIVDKGYNSGVEDTRRIGISIANGDFIMHMDQDDYYFPYAIETLINNYKETQAEIIVANSVRCVFSKHLKYGYNRISNEMRKDQVIDNMNFMEYYFGSFLGMKAIIPVALWNKLYLASFIKSTEEPPRVNYAEEDINYNMHIFPQATRISLCKDVTHLWRWGGVSSSGSGHFDIDSRRILYNNKVSLIRKYNCKPLFLEKAALEMITRYEYFFNREANTNLDDFKSIYKIHIRDKEYIHALSIVKNIVHPHYVDLMLKDDVNGLYKELLNNKVKTNNIITYAKKFLGII